MTIHPQTIEACDTLRKNAYIGKQRYFSASERASNLNSWFGVAEVIISVFLGSTFIVLITYEIPLEFKWAGTFSALILVVLSVTQTFFSFQKTSMAHRAVANQYLDIQRECESILATYCDGLASTEKIFEELARLNARYTALTTSAENLQTMKGDYQHALRMLRRMESYEKESKVLLHRSDLRETQRDTTHPEEVYLRH
jgi:hypothetical protein